MQMVFVLIVSDLCMLFQEPQDSDLDDFGNPSGSALINQLGWKSDDPSDIDSDHSNDSLTGDDQIDFERWISFFGSSNSETEDSLSDADSESSNADSVYSFAAPPYSPIQNSFLTPDSNGKVCDDTGETAEYDTNKTFDLVNQPANVQSFESPGVTDNQENSTMWNGFKLVGDNIDKNYRPSFHRLDKKTTSIHYFHFYAVQDRIDLSSCSDTPRTDPIDVKQLLVDTKDIAKLHDDAIILISRLVLLYITIHSNVS